MKIGGLQKTTLIDYPGKIACTVFLVGCNFRCPWCYNLELVLPARLATRNVAGVAEKDFFDFLKEKMGLLDGVVICGGEPTIHKDLLNFIQKIKKLGFLVKLDTNGSNSEMLGNLIEKKIIDYIAMDVKEIPKNPNIKKSIEIIKNSKIDYEFRTTLVPTIHTKKIIFKIAKNLSPANAYFLQNFRPGKTLNPKFQNYKPFTQKQLEVIQKECQKYLPTKIRN